MPKISIQENFNFFADPDKSILSSIEEQFLEVDYNCRAGYCGICKAELVKGKVRYNEPPICPLNEKEVLTCCAAPSGDIELKFQQKLENVTRRIGDDSLLY